MAMVVRTNVMAINANRQLGMNNSKVGLSLEKLSSGFRINRAGDDASGLAISEKMKAQIKGLDTAVANSQDGISLIQTAEGALTEVHDMLNRMVELCGKSANGTMDDVIDRKAIQEEVDSLKSEIDRIAKGTNFNGLKLLDGSLDAGREAVAAGTKTTDVDVAFSDLVPAAGSLYADLGTKSIVQGTAVPAAASHFSVDLSNYAIKDAKDGDKIEIQIGGSKYTLENDAEGGGDIDLSDTESIATALMAAIEDGATFNDGTTDFDVDDSDTTAASVTVTLNGTNGITITQNGDPATDAEVMQTGLTVNITPDLTSADAKETGSWNKGTTDNLQGGAAKEASLASTAINVDDLLANFGDGMKLSIGGTEYTVALGADSTNKTATNVIDLTAYKDKAALVADKDNVGRIISEATASNAVFTTGYDVDTDKLTFHEVATGSGKDMTTVDKIAAQFSLKGTLTEATPAVEAGKALTLQIGDTAAEYNQMSVSVKDMSCAGLGIGELSVATQVDAQKALAMLKNYNGNPANYLEAVETGAGAAGGGSGAVEGTDFGAINTVSSQRAQLGALQNRLDHTINNLEVASENMTSANSRIRDTDMAKEIMNFTKMNVLTQAAQAMLAQANMQPQSVLQLLG